MVVRAGRALLQLPQQRALGIAQLGQRHAGGDVEQPFNARQDAQHEAQWAEFASKEDQLLLDKAPELADKARQQKIADSAVSVLEDVGFSKEDLAKAWNGKQAVSLRDHRLQLLILDAIKYREAKTNAAKPAPKPVPPVQRPGTSKPATNSVDDEIATLTRRVSQTGSIKDMTALQLAKMKRAANQ